MAVNIDVTIAYFDVTGDVTSLGPRWLRWTRAFQYYIVGRGVSDTKQKKALLLHSAGMAVQEICETLRDPGPPTAAGETDSTDEYDKALRTLDSYFKPKVNIHYERHMFRQIAQESYETID